MSTDKVDTEIPSPFAGIVEAILVAEDEVAAVGADLAVIGDGSGAAAAPAAPAVEAAPAPAPVSYTHLDVYKRQAHARSSFRQSSDREPGRVSPRLSRRWRELHSRIRLG